MTVSAQNSYSGPFLPNGVTTDFPFTFEVVTASELGVIIDGLEIDPGDYDVTLNEDNEGGTVSFAVAPTGDELFIVSDPEFKQETAFENAGPFLARNLEQALDRGIVIANWLRSGINRSIRLPVGEEIDPIPDAATRADSMVGFDEVGDLALYDPLTFKGDRGDPGPPGSGGGLVSYTSRAAYKADAANLGDGDLFFLNEGNRSGVFKHFVPTGADIAKYNARATADSVEGIYFSNDPANTDAAGVAERQFWHGFWIFDWFLNADQIGDWTTGLSADCLPAFTAMNALMDTMDFNVSVSYVANGPAVYFPSAQYYFSDKVVLNRAMHLRGGMQNEIGERTFLRWPASKGGIVVNRAGSTATGEVSATIGGTGSSIEGFVFQGGGGTPVGAATAELEYSAIRLKDRATIKNCKMRNWRGVGICLSVSTGEPTSSLFFGNGNGISVENVRIESCKFGGVWVSGGDSNVINLTNVDVALCGRFGMWLSPFLGVYLANCQVADCGTPAASGLTEYSIVAYSGRAYYAKYDASTATLQGETPGTGSNWLDMGSAASLGIPNANAPTWDGTHNYVPGGAYGGTGAFCLLQACYYETGQAPPQLPGAFMNGGFMYSDPRVGGPWLRAGNQGLNCTRGIARDIAYADGTTAFTGVGVDFHSFSGVTTWLDTVGWQSSEVGSGAKYSMGLEKATGDWAYLIGGAYSPSAINVFRILGVETGRTYGGASQADLAWYTEMLHYSVGNGNNALRRDVGNAAPTTGYHRAGDIVYNDGSGGTTVATADRWLCTVSGTPGTWVAKT